MKRARFRDLARRAVDRLPAQFRNHLATVEFVIEDDPSPELLESLGMDPDEDTLLGFYDGVPRTLEEIGDEFNLTRERIRQLEKLALCRLRHPSFGIREADLV